MNSVNMICVQVMKQKSSKQESELNNNHNHNHNLSIFLPGQTRNQIKFHNWNLHQRKQYQIHVIAIKMKIWKIY